MNRPGYNPTRRNRNIGTEKSGWGQNNRLVIPMSWADSHLYYEKLIDPVEVAVMARSVPLHILVEPPHQGFFHACTVEDILHLLQWIPVAHLEGIKLIVLRQPKRKERILCPIWGRWNYCSEIGAHWGPGIFIEAIDFSHSLKWDKSLSPDSARELERLREDGHSIASDKRGYQIACTLDSVRRTQLYRTLPHEIGHYVDFLQSVIEPSGHDSEKLGRLDARYRRKPSREKEVFAHRYADEFRSHLTAEGRLPFDRIVDKKKMMEQGLRPEWFVTENE